MKKQLLIVILMCTVLSLGAQTVITGWSFPVNSGPDSLNANTGLPGNLGYDIRFEGTDTVYETIFFATGATDYAAAATGWDNGMDARFWSVKFKAENYGSFKISSKQSSSGEFDGPRDFKLQWKISGGSYADVPSGSVTVADDWTTGVVSTLDLPVTGQGSSSVYVRWIMTSNTSVMGGAVNPLGETRIDDILITGVSSLGNNEILFSNRLTVSPNPSQGIFSVRSTVPLKEIRIVGMDGKTVMNNACQGSVMEVSLPGLAAGTYALSVKFDDQDAWYTRQIIVK
jgi:hypothetical protein